jgi:hypothetical protein
MATPTDRGIEPLQCRWGNLEHHTREKGIELFIDLLRQVRSTASVGQAGVKN